MKHHPDKNPDKPEASAEKFKQVHNSRRTASSRIAS